MVKHFTFCKNYILLWTEAECSTWRLIFSSLLNLLWENSQVDYWPLIGSLKKLKHDSIVNRATCEQVRPLLHTSLTSLPDDQTGRWHLALADTDWMISLIMLWCALVKGAVCSLGAECAFMSIQTRQQMSPPGCSCLHRWLSPHGDCSESHCSLNATSLGNFTLQSTMCVKGCVWNVQQSHLCVQLARANVNLTW